MNLNQIAQISAAEWLDYTEGEERADRALGRRAASGDPATVARAHRDFEETLVSRAKGSALKLRAELGELGKDLRRQINELEREREDHLGERIREVAEQRRQALQNLDNTIGSSSARYRSTALRLEEAERALRGIRAEVRGRPLRRGLVPIYPVVMALLALAEAPINRLAFELFFQEQPIISLALALMVGAVLIFFAHVVGTLLRRTESTSTVTQQVKRVLGILVCLGVAGCLMYLLAGMRQLYVRLLDSEQQGLREQVERLMQGSAADALATATSTDMGPAGWTLLAINVALFVFGVAASFLRHDPHPDYENAWRAVERGRRRIARMTRRFEKRASALTRKFEQQKRALDDLARQLQAKLSELREREATIAPFHDDIRVRIANSVRKRSLAFVQGLTSRVGANGQVGEPPRAMTEADIRALLGEVPERVAG